jgi:hypothetical protein
MEVSPLVVCVSQTYQTNDRQPEVLRAVRAVHVFVLPSGRSPLPQQLKQRQVSVRASRVVQALAGKFAGDNWVHLFSGLKSLAP